MGLNLKSTLIAWLTYHWNYPWLRQLQMKMKELNTIL